MRDLEQVRVDSLDTNPFTATLRELADDRADTKPVSSRNPPITSLDSRSPPKSRSLTSTLAAHYLQMSTHCLQEGKGAKLLLNSPDPLFMQGGICGRVPGKRLRRTLSGGYNLGVNPRRKNDKVQRTIYSSTFCRRIDRNSLCTPGTRYYGPCIRMGRGKGQQNEGKHGVTFDETKTIFNDPFAITVSDPNHSDEEEHWLDIGLSAEGRLLVVWHTERDERIRIIGSRKATKSEERAYTHERT